MSWDKRYPSWRSWWRYYYLQWLRNLNLLCGLSWVTPWCRYSYSRGMRLSTISWSSIWVIIGNTKWIDKTESKVVSTMSSLVNKRKNRKISKILTWFNQKRCKNLCFLLQLGKLIQVLTLHVISLATNINALTLIRCTFASILLFVMEVMFWILVGIKRCYICNAKFLSNSFYRFCTMFELFEDKQRAKLGGVDAPKCIYFSKHFAS